MWAGSAEEAVVEVLRQCRSCYSSPSVLGGLAAGFGVPESRAPL